MSTLTPKLGLKKPDAADPFLRKDFLDNWDKIDAAPGLHICTSQSRPTWTKAMAGRLIMETDTQRQVLWTGTAWDDPISSPPIWTLAINVSQSLNKGAAATYNIGTFTTKRAMWAACVVNVTVACYANSPQVVSARTLIDGVDSTRDAAGTTFVQFPKGNGGGYRDYRQISMNATRSVSSGSHNIAVLVTCGTISSEPVNVSKANVMIIGSTTGG